MTDPVFNNRENKSFEVDDNGTKRLIWESRSMAVHGILFIKFNGELYILLTRRSKKCPDEVGKIANVSGYLDWDETLFEAMKREFWEETRLNFDYYFSEKNLLKGSLEPLSIESNPKKSRQNVTTRFLFLFEVDKLPFVIETEETSMVKFEKVSEVEELCKEEPDSFAWNHAEVILNCIEKIK